MPISDNAYIGEVFLFAGGSWNHPEGTADCDGSPIPIAQNEALFAIIGTSFGGDGVSTFALPDLRGRMAVGTPKDTRYGDASGPPGATTPVAAGSGVAAVPVRHLICLVGTWPFPAA